ncbi:hypothetical protein INR49_017749 [Caranx melampygus]|nr:hypothetical protein INR49_017749 [Caranx melampygus]
MGRPGRRGVQATDDAQGAETKRWARSCSRVWTNHQRLLLLIKQVLMIQSQKTPPDFTNCIYTENIKVCPPPSDPPPLWGCGSD